MIKGIMLGICIAVFVVSLIFLSTGMTGNLHENLITGAVVGLNLITSFSLITLILSFIIMVFILLTLRKSSAQ